jgi:hypothetical protein
MYCKSGWILTLHSASHADRSDTRSRHRNSSQRSVLVRICRELAGFLAGVKSGRCGDASVAKACSIRAYIALVLVLVEGRIAGTIIADVVADSGKVTDAAPAQRMMWVGSAITAPYPAGTPETRGSTTSRRNRGLVESETLAQSASTKTEVTTSAATLVESV